MQKLLSLLKSKPAFLFFLPVFFVLHGFTDNYSAVPLKDALLLVLLYLLVSLVLFIIAWLIYRSYRKGAILVFFIMSFHFFFGAIQDFLKASFDDSFITRYGFLIPFFFCCFILLFILLKRTSGKLSRTSYYLNILFCFLILIDVGWLIKKVIAKQPLSFKSTSQFVTTCYSCTKPDIYFLVFDEYEASTALKELWHYDNSDLDTFLVNKGFKVLPDSRSNYNFTQFSMASTLNMDYLTIPNPNACTVKDYNNCYELIKTNNVCNTLTALGYKIVNYSIFDLPKNPTLVTEDFLPLKTKLITAQTFLSRIRKDLFYHLLTGKFKLNWLSNNLIYATYKNNEKIIRKTIQESRTYSAQPKFVYSHIEMPHPPFYFNKYGQKRDKQKLIKETAHNDIRTYLDYLPSTNEVIKKLINNIINNTKRPFVIVLMGDHGFRSMQPKNYYFRNLNALYISSGNYTGFYDHITNVNQFRVLFNNLFGASFPLKKDSTVFLTDK